MIEPAEFFDKHEPEIFDDDFEFMEEDLDEKKKNFLYIAS